jgi:REP element-mobilizing transposase RayT
MPDYRRNRVPGGTFFFTVNLRDPRSDLLVTQIDIMRNAVRRVRARTPFRIDAWVVLPDHMHCLWTLPQGDADFPGRWRNQNRICGVFAYRRVTVTGDDQPRRAGHLAASVLGAHGWRTVSRWVARRQW